MTCVTDGWTCSVLDTSAFRLTADVVARCRQSRMSDSVTGSVRFTSSAAMMWLSNCAWLTANRTYHAASSACSRLVLRARRASLCASHAAPAIAAIAPAACTHAAASEFQPDLITLAPAAHPATATRTIASANRLKPRASAAPRTILRRRVRLFRGFSTALSCRPADTAGSGEFCTRPSFIVGFGIAGGRHQLASLRDELLAQRLI